MITLEVHSQFIAWPDDFALVMMRYYRHHGVPFKIHRKCVHTGCSPGAVNASSAKPAGPFAVR